MMICVHENHTKPRVLSQESLPELPVSPQRKDSCLPPGQQGQATGQENNRPMADREQPRLL